MKRKLILRYGLLSLPFLFGLFLYGIGLYNIASSLLFFVGGYVLLKNLCDYRKIKRNIGKINNRNCFESNLCISNEKERENVKSSIVMKKMGEEKEMILFDIRDDVRLCDNMEKDNVEIKKYRTCEDIPGIKRIRVYKRVRRRY